MIFKPLRTPINAFLAMLRAFWWSLRGYRVLVDEADELERKAECLNCDEYAEESGQCKICTCLIEAKTRVASEQCPKRKWLRVKQKRVTV